MPVIDSIKGAFIKSALTKLTEGDHGSTALGTLAVAILGANLDYAKLSRGFADTDSAIECGKATGLVILFVWSWFIGRREKKAAAQAASQK